MPGITHAFVSAVADGGDATLVRPSNWNAAHIGDGWLDATSETWTQTAATTFTVPTDLTGKYTPGTRLVLTQTTVKYFVVVSSSYGAPNTTVTVTGGTDYTLAAAAISVNYYSYNVNPQGYPQWFNHTPTYTGFTGTPTTTRGRFAVVGRQCTIEVLQTAGTSNATTFTLTLPIAPAAANIPFPARGQDNGTNMTTPALAYTRATTTLDLYKDFQGLAWTNSGTKLISFCFTYEI